MSAQPKADCQGFTFFELLIVIAVLCVLAALLLPTGIHRPSKSTALRVQCVSNLKQIGRAYNLWAGDHMDKFPMQVSVTNCGTMELTGNGTAYLHFLVLSNELEGSPKVLRCPAEKRKKAMETFAPGFTNSNLSYFVGLDAAMDLPQALLSGDDNFCMNEQCPNELRTPPGVLLSLLSNTPVAYSEERHKRNGNIVLSDGSAQRVSSAKFREALRVSGVVTNRLLLP